MQIAMTPDQFRAARQAAGLTQAAAGALLGVTQVTVARWETGVHPIPKAAGMVIQQAAKAGRAATKRQLSDDQDK